MRPPESAGRSESWLPFVYGGWCMHATTQVASVAAKSASSHASCSDPGPTPLLSESSMTKWALP